MPDVPKSDETSADTANNRPGGPAGRPEGGGDTDVDVMADRFRRVREAHQMELAEDYVELIADLIAATGEARVVDLAGRLGVSNATVNNAIQRLQRDGLVTSRPYRSIFLTEQGRDLAESSRERHHLVRDFLVALGVEPQTAEADAEGIEHHVSAQTLEAFRAFLAGKAPRD